jgi:hypothetical protein
VAPGRERSFTGHAQAVPEPQFLDSAPGEKGKWLTATNWDLSMNIESDDHATGLILNSLMP